MPSEVEQEITTVCRLLESVQISREAEKVDVDAIGVETYTDALRKLLNLVGGAEDDVGADVLALVMIVAVGHSGKHYWTNPTNRDLAKELLDAICQIYNHDDCESLLDKEAIFLEATLAYLRGALIKDTWKQFPLYKQALVWLIKHLKHPHISCQLAFFLPPVLWLLDDHLDSNRKLSLSALTHIINQMDPTELRWLGRADLLYQALKPLLFVNSSDIIYSLHPCLLSLLPVLDYGAQEKKIHEVFFILVDQLAKEPRISQQRAYAAHLHSYIELLGIFSVRYIKSLLPVLISLLKHRDPNKDLLRSFSLQALLALVTCSWPRMRPHRLTIVSALSALVQEMSSYDSTCPGEEAMLELVVKCLTVLRAACPELKDDYQWLAENCSHSTMSRCLHQAIVQDS